MQKTRNITGNLRCCMAAMCFFLASISLSMANSDVRILVDISGSMKKNDPNNLRKPAIELLIDLLPQDSKAGIWSFGEYVNMLVKHQLVDDQWREAAKQQLSAISNLGQRTDIGEVLQKSAYDFDYSNFKEGVQFILLTDGLVDISSKQESNDQERQRILKQVVDRFKEKGAIIHTVALSDAADLVLLEQLSIRTQGVADVAYQAQDLMPIFLRAFDSFQNTPRLPLNNNQFDVDSLVKQFTALIFHDNQSVTLLDPNGERIDRLNVLDNVNWKATDAYDLITVSQPTAGQWQIEGELGPLSRINVLSDLLLEVTPLANNMFDMDLPELKAWLLSEDELISDNDFLQLMQVSLIDDDGQQSTTIPMQQQNAQFISERKQFKQGVHQLTVRVDGQTFLRDYVQTVSIRPVFSVQLSAQEGQYLIEITKNDQSIDDQAVQLSALRTQQDQQVQQALTLTSAGVWQLVVESSVQPSLVDVQITASYDRDFQSVKYQPIYDTQLVFPVTNVAAKKMDSVISSRPLSLSTDAQTPATPKVPTIEQNPTFDVVVSSMPILSSPIDMQASDTMAIPNEIEAAPPKSELIEESNQSIEQNLISPIQPAEVEKNDTKPEPEASIVDDSLSLSALLITTASGLALLILAYIIYRRVERKTLDTQGNPTLTDSQEKSSNNHVPESQDGMSDDNETLLNDASTEQLSSMQDFSDQVNEEQSAAIALTEDQQQQINEQVKQGPQETQASAQEQELAEDFDLADIEDLDVDDFESLNLDQQEETYDEKK